MSAGGFVDACGFIAASGGTGDFVVNTAAPGYRTPASAGAGNGVAYSYRAQSSDLSEWEDGFGPYATGTTTLARSTVIASSTGSKVSFTAPPNVYITYLAADILNVPSIGGMFRNLKLSTTGLGVNTSVSADAIVVEDTIGNPKKLFNVSLTIATTSSGANGLDTGSVAASTWYSVWVIWNGSTASGLLSLSATSPTMPAGYTHKARVGWIRTGSAHSTWPLPMVQYGNSARWVVTASSEITSFLILASGSATTAVSVANFVPTTAKAIVIGISANSLGSSGAQVRVGSVSGNYEIYSGNTVAAGGAGASGCFELILVSSNVYYASNNGSGQIFAFGWEDNL